MKTLSPYLQLQTRLLQNSCREGQYCNIMVGRAKSSIQNVFGSLSEMLVESAKLLGGSGVNFGYGAYSSTNYKFSDARVNCWIFLSLKGAML